MASIRPKQPPVAYTSNIGGNVGPRHYQWCMTAILEAIRATSGVQLAYSTRIKELGNWREAISVKRLGFMIKFFTTKCTYRCTMLFKVLEPFQQIHFFLSKNFFFSFWLILTTKITLKKNSFICMLVRCVNTNFIFCWGFSANFCGYGTQNSKNTKSGIFPKIFNKIP